MKDKKLALACDDSHVRVFDLKGELHATLSLYTQKSETTDQRKVPDTGRFITCCWAVQNLNPNDKKSIRKVDQINLWAGTDQGGLFGWIVNPTKSVSSL